MNSTDSMITGGGSDDKAQGWIIGDIENSDLIRSIYGIIAAIGITGNFLVCWVLLRVPSLRSNTSDFLVHLAAVDLIVCLWTVPFHLFPHVPEHDPGFWGELKCRLYSSKAPLWTFALISICSLVTVNLERYIAIVYPIKYKNIYNRRNTILMIAACWVVGIISNSYFWYAFGVTSSGACGIIGWPSKGFQVLLGLYNFVSYYLAPFTFMVLTQWKVIKTLKRQARILKEKRKRANGHSVHASRTNTESRKMWQVHAAQELSKTLLLVTILYTVCWTPNQLLFLVFNCGPNDVVDFQSVYYHITVVLSVANSCLNPIIYTIQNRPFRRGIQKVFGCYRVHPTQTEGQGLGTSEGLGSDNLVLGHGAGVITVESTCTNNDNQQVDCQGVEVKP
ncbi:allatostatin-A receptor-like [Asterias rubens]|uniref:allatostatin-A receptor-like n=1 Tax=Asterias rubens TaxID=7604 RepID=UPI001455AE09|nr:allatostatin-A receptor-like [Asterias rubens]